MATVFFESELTPQMVTQAMRAMSEEKLVALERELRAERLRRLTAGIPPQDRALLESIRRAAPHDERFATLREAQGERSLSLAEEAELARLVEEREAFNVARLSAAMRLAELRGVPFDELWRQLGGVPQGPRRVAS